MHGSNSGSRLRGFRLGSLVFWTIQIGLLFWRVPSPSAEWRPSADSARVVASSPFHEMITAAAMGEGVDPALVEAVVAVESAFRPRAVSRKGAMGLMQLMPQTARLLGVSDAFDPRQNLIGGTRHLRNLLDLFGGDLPRALAAYNAGANAVRTYGGIPPYRETREYVRMVLARYQPGPVPPSSTSWAPAGPPASDPAPVQEEAKEAESSAPDDLRFARATRLVRTDAPLVQMRDAPMILVKSREYPSVRSREFSR
jgi:transglycosylase-like protein with SLT domain